MEAWPWQECHLSRVVRVVRRATCCEGWCRWWKGYSLLSVFPWVRIALDDRSLTKKKNRSNLKYTLLSWVKISKLFFIGGTCRKLLRKKDFKQEKVIKLPRWWIFQTFSITYNPWSWSRYSSMCRFKFWRSKVIWHATLVSEYHD